MRIITVPAIYASELEAEIRRVVDRIDRHRAVDVPGDERLGRLANAIIAPEMIDRSAVGQIVVTVAELPADSSAKVFEIPAGTRAA